MKEVYMGEKIGSMMSLFSGSGSFEHIAENLDIEAKYNAEVEPYPIKVTTARFPNTVMLGDVSKVKGGEIEPVDLITFGSPCFVAGTLIHTQRGHIPIEEVRIGDMVYTHMNRWRMVTERMVNPTNHIYDIDFGVTTIKVTGNHPLYVKENPNSEPIWKAVEDIKNTDLVAYETFNHNESVLLWKHIIAKQKEPYADTVYNLEVREDHSYIANGIVSHNCQSLSMAGKREGIRHSDLGDDEATASGLFMEAMRIIKEMREATNGEKPRFILWENVCFSADTLVTTWNGVKRIADVTPGEYVKTHTGEYKRVALLHKNEEQETISLKIKGTDPITVTPNHPIYVRKNRNSEPEWIEAGKISEGDLVGYLVDGFGKRNIDVETARSLGKKIPTSFFPSEVFEFNTRGQIEVLNGILESAATKETPTNNFCVYTTILNDEKIAYETARLVRNIYRVNVSIESHERKGKYWVLSYSLKHDNSSEDYYDGRVWQKVTGINDGEKMTVYNLSVEENNTYEANGITVHNCGAFSSSNGEDFRTVLEEIESIAAGKRVSVPRPPESWSARGSILGECYSIAWRTLDAQYWGVPQRRKRIYLVADFGGQCAEQILFEREGLLGDIEQGKEKG